MTGKKKGPDKKVSPEQFASWLTDYLEDREERGMLPTIVTFCKYIKLSKEQFYKNYRYDPEYIEACQWLYTCCQADLEDAAFNPQDDSRNPATLMFGLKNWGYSDNPTHKGIQFEVKPGLEVDQADDILRQVAEGEMPPSVGAHLVQTIKAKADIRKTSELEARLIELERIALQGG